MATFPTIHPDAITAIVSGVHGAPFDVLGAHPYEAGLVVRAFLPQAAVLELLTPTLDPPERPMQRVHWDGFFEVILPDVQLPLRYHFRLTTFGGETHLLEDPYAVPPTHTDYHPNQMAEG
ncbi:MAG: 1,4-alpha-glucan branching enzyme, partial [Chloroflexota bacterium]